MGTSDFISDFNKKLEKLGNKVSSSDLEKITKALKSLSANLSKNTEYMNSLGFMEATGQRESNAYALISSNRKVIQNSFNTNKDSVLKILSSTDKKLAKQFSSNFVIPNTQTSENKATINAMTNTFKENYSKKLHAIASFLPEQIAQQFVKLMEDYEETIGSANISDAEKFAKTRVNIDQRLAELGCIQLKHLVINDRNFMVADTLSANFSSDIKSAVESTYYAQTTLMNNENYRTAACFAETLKVSYLASQGLNDEYGEKTFDEIDYASQAKAGQIGFSVFNPNNYGQGLIDQDTLNVFDNQIQNELCTMFDCIIPCATSPEQSTQPQQPPVLSEDLINSALNSINLVDKLSALPPEKREEMKSDIITKSAVYINEKLSTSSNNANRFTANYENNNLTQTIINEDNNILTETSSTTNLDEPNKYDTKQVTQEMTDFEITDSNGKTTNYLTCIETYESTIYTSTEQALVFENTPTTRVLTIKDPSTKENIVVNLDENNIITNIVGNEKIAEQVHSGYISSLSLEKQEIYQQALYEKELEEQAKAEEQTAEPENETNAYDGPSRDKFEKMIASLQPQTPISERSDLTPSPKDISPKENDIEAENEDVMVMTRKSDNNN